MISKPVSNVPLGCAARGRRVLLGGIFSSVFAVAAVIPQTTIEHGPVLCVVKLATGLDCPLCGMTRAFVFAAHGSFAAASQFNPAWPLAAVLLLGVVVLCWRDAGTGSNNTGRLGRWLVARGWVIVALLALLTVVRWVWP